MQKTSFVLNILIFLLTLLTLVKMLCGNSKDKELTGKGIKIFKYFTVDSNVLMGIAALVYAIYLFLVLRGTDTAVPHWCVLLKLSATASVALTMVTVLVFLAPTCKKGYLAMFTGSNFFFHLTIPLLSILDFIFFVQGKEIRFAETVWGIIPAVLYAAAYACYVLKHAENGKVSKKYDWYGFVQGGTQYAALAALIVVSGAYLLTVLLWLCR